MSTQSNHSRLTAHILIAGALLLVGAAVVMWWGFGAAATQTMLLGNFILNCF